MRRKGERAAFPESGPGPEPEPGTRPNRGDETERRAAREDETAPSVVVGIGASAGGLAAAREVLANLPRDSKVCVIFVPHLSPDQKSMMAELLSGPSPLPVAEAQQGQRLERGHCYVIPPGRLLEVKDGHFHLVPRPAGERVLPIDHMFRSIAERYGARAVGVVLSGTASDGAAGLGEIRAAGGLTIAQDPDTAEFDGMPRAAIATGHVDLVLPPARIAQEIPDSEREPRIEDGALERASEDGNELFSLLRAFHGIDFSQYKPPTIRRRLQRRMMIRRAHDLGSYLEVLKSDPEEVRRLGDDLLIQVTRFFREAESFELLSNVVFPRILEGKSSDESLRVWVPGCATGEEAYSVAIAFFESASERAPVPTLQIFATDVSESAIERARSGVYPRNLEAEVSSDRLRRFFLTVENGYRVNPTLREQCIFARQDLTRDPPFLHLDLVVCRNLLIYLLPSAQQRAIRLFHFALRPGGHLLLGESETVGNHGNLFSIADKKHKLYAKRPVATPIDFRRPASGVAVDAAGARPRSAGRRIDSSAEARRILIERYAKPAVVVDGDFQIVESLGRTGRYLELGPGAASLSVLSMARPGLVPGLRAAIGECQQEGAPAQRTGLRMDLGGSIARVDVLVTRLRQSEGGPDRYLVIFEEEAAEGPGSSAAIEEERERERDSSKRSEGARRLDGGDASVRALEDELESTRVDLSSIIQELESANEELQSANEEVLSSNEELQSTNEELDTAREELQSTNEEIGTVNEELRARNEELVRVNSDLENVLGNIRIAIVIVAEDLRIRRFTDEAGRLLNLIHADVGRPIGQIRPNFDLPELEERIRAVIDGVEPFEQEVRSESGRWFSIRIRPYKDVENRIDGAVIALSDVTALKEHELEARSARDLADAIVDAVRDSLLVIDADFRVIRVNDSFRDRFRVSARETMNAPLWELGNGQWDIPELRRLLEEVLPEDASIEGYVVEHEFPQIGRKRMSLNARRIETGETGGRILLVIQEMGAPE